MRGRYETRDRGSTGEYEVYTHDLDRHGVKVPVSLNVDWVPKDQKAWLLEVLSGEFERVAREAHRAGVLKVRVQVRTALGIMGSDGLRS